jgi:hypothetical protein
MLDIDLALFERVHDHTSALTLPLCSFGLRAGAIEC